MNSVLAVIVTFNRLDYLKKSVISVLEQDVEAVIVVDNCSTDDTKEWLSEVKSSRLIKIHLDTNTGGAGGFYVGFKYAVEHFASVEWILCYDDDAYPVSNTIETFRESIWDSDVGGVGAAVYHTDGSIAEMNRPVLNPFRSAKVFLSALVLGRSGFHIKDKAYSGVDNIDVDALSFVGLFVRIKLVAAEFGLPRKELFIYADDTIYTLQIRNKGYRNIFMPKLVFVHDCKTLLSGRKIYVPIWKVYYTYRNSIELFRNLSGRWYVVLLASKIVKWVYDGFYYENKKTYYRLFNAALKDGVKRDFSRTHNDVRTLAESE